MHWAFTGWCNKIRANNVADVGHFFTFYCRSTCICLIILVIQYLTCPFQSLGMYDIAQTGYSIAKWGNIAMTRSFANCTPSMEADGVKSYALAPSITETQLTRYITSIEQQNVNIHDFVLNNLEMTWKKTKGKMEKQRGL